MIYIYFIISVPKKYFIRFKLSNLFNIYFLHAGLFQHHDAITGTSKSFVMRDYGLKLFESLRDTTLIQQNSLQSLLFPNVPLKPDQTLVLSDIERESYEKLPRKTPIQLGPEEANLTKKIVVYNSLARHQEEVVKLRTSTSNVKVTDEHGNDIMYQINPVWDMAENMKPWIVQDEFELVFIASMPALSVTIYNLVYVPINKEKLATIYCKSCQTRIIVNGNTAKPEVVRSVFNIKDIPPGDIQLENTKLKILFNGNTGFMRNVRRKHNPKIMQCAIQFAAYHSAQFHSGAYLFMPDPNEREYEKDVLQQYKDQKSIMITTGSVSTEITVMYGPFLIHSVSIFLAENSSLSEAIMIENTVDFETPPKNRETEMFMRILSDVQNGEPPEFYTDSNGFSMQRRIKVERIGLEGNYFPITSMVYIQDSSVRLTLMTDHAQGSASWQPGYLEVSKIIEVIYICVIVLVHFTYTYKLVFIIYLDSL